jgi:2-dehydropantoate 2-reductase
MKILIYGGGAVGLGLASCLIKSGEHVDIIARNNTATALRAKGLIRTGIFGRVTASAKAFGAYPSIAALPRGAYDSILIAVKSFDSAAAAQDLARHPWAYHAETKFILCQNGWGNAELFTRRLPKKQIYNARIITGFTRPQPNAVIITVHADAIRIGSLFHTDITGLTGLCDSITVGGIPCRTTKHIEKDLWSKMLYNCALNPLGAILNVPYGALAENDFTRTFMDTVIEEVFAVMQKAHFQTHWKTARGYRKAFYTQFVPATATHRSSMLQDIAAGRKTEIDALNGIVVRLAQRYRIPVPANRMVYKIIAFIEQKKRKEVYG